MKSFNLYVRLVCLIGFITLSVQNLNADNKNASKSELWVENYSYPFTRSYQSTLALALARPSEQIDLDPIRITIHPERSNLRVIGKRNSTPVQFFPGTNLNSPIIFIIPGLGGHGLSPSALLLGELLSQNGFAVLTFSSTMSWQFAVAASSTGLPGHPKQDAADMYSLMKLGYERAKIKYKINPQHISILGYSLGGADAANVVDQDLKNKYFKFKKILMINPPFNQQDGISFLDQLLLPGRKYSAQYQENLLVQATGMITDFIVKPYTAAQLERRISTSPFNEEQISWLVGMTFRDSLKNIVAASQQVHDLGILKTPESERESSAYIAEASKYSFSDYAKLFLKQGVNQSDDFVDNNSLKNTILSWQNKGIKWAMFHNQNDFLWNQDIANFLSTVPSESKIYPLGGHLGNLWIKQNQEDIVEFLKK
jgi:hypothetical protein